MSNQATIESGRGHWRMAGWSTAVALLLLPFVAMQFTSEVNWTGSDFVLWGCMLLFAGLALEFLTRRAGSWAYRLGAGVAVLAAFLLVWVNAAVGLLGDEGNPANLMFVGVIAVALAGSIAGRFQPDGMAKAMFAAAAAQLLAGLVGLAAGWASPGGEGIYEVLLGTTLFGGLWLLSAALFRSAAR